MQLTAYLYAIVQGPDKLLRRCNADTLIIHYQIKIQRLATQIHKYESSVTDQLACTLLSTIRVRQFVYLLKNNKSAKFKT